MCGSLTLSFLVNIKENPNQRMLIKILSRARQDLSPTVRCYKFLGTDGVSTTSA